MLEDKQVLENIVESGAIEIHVTRAVSKLILFFEVVTLEVVETKILRIS